MEFEKVITWMDWITICFSFITMILVIINFFKNKKQLDKIELCFAIEGQNEICIPTYLMRKHITRAEISGLLGFIQKNSKERHNIVYLSSEQYLKDIYDIQSGKKDRLLINVTKEEMEQFDI
ncbi:MAG: hypothetical protein RBR23_10380 [Arcobacteraceae bacterium]|jgi:hypothetical protein|nr:hypothetical protein [Arcobacteraceae bacterium]